jgi:hypothetical protein
MGWDGRRWTQESVPNPGLAPDPAAQAEGLNAVSCVSSTACIAVGITDQVAVGELPMAVFWNGAGWASSLASDAARQHLAAAAQTWLPPYESGTVTGPALQPTLAQPREGAASPEQCC